MGIIDFLWVSMDIPPSINKLLAILQMIFKACQAKAIFHQGSGWTWRQSLRDAVRSDVDETKEWRKSGFSRMNRMGTVELYGGFPYMYWGITPVIEEIDGWFHGTSQSQMDDWGVALILGNFHIGMGQYDQ